MLHPGDLLPKHAMSGTGEAIGLTATRTVVFAEALDPAIVEQPAECAVQGAGAEADALVADLGYVLHDGVAVPGLVGEAEENEEDGLGKRFHTASYDMSSDDILCRRDGRSQGKSLFGLGLLQNETIRCLQAGAEDPITGCVLGDGIDVNDITSEGESGAEWDNMGVGVRLAVEVLISEGEGFVDLVDRQDNHRQVQGAAGMVCDNDGAVDPGAFAR